MFDEPNEGPADRPLSPTDRAKEKSDEFRMHAELAAVFEGCRKFDARIYPGFDPGIAREVQRGFGRLEKSKSAESPILPEQSAAEAAGLLDLPNARERRDSNRGVLDQYLHAERAIHAADGSGD